MQKFVNLVDLVESFLPSIYLQKSASIQPRTGLSKFAKNYPNVFFRTDTGWYLRVLLHAPQEVVRRARVVRVRDRHAVLIVTPAGVHVAAARGLAYVLSNSVLERIRVRTDFVLTLTFFLIKNNFFRLIAYGHNSPRSNYTIFCYNLDRFTGFSVDARSTTSRTVNHQKYGKNILA